MLNIILKAHVLKTDRGKPTTYEKYRYYEKRDIKERRKVISNVNSKKKKRMKCVY